MLISLKSLEQMPILLNVKKSLFLLPIFFLSCAPSVTDQTKTTVATTSGLTGNPAPLAEGQSWKIESTLSSGKVGATVQIKTLEQPNSGIYSNGTALGLLGALSGTGDPVVVLNNNAQSLTFFFRDNKTPYSCKIVNPDAGATAFTGTLSVRDDVVGVCSAVRL